MLELPARAFDLGLYGRQLVDQAIGGLVACQFDQRCAMFETPGRALQVEEEMRRRAVVGDLSEARTRGLSEDLLAFFAARSQTVALRCMARDQAVERAGLRAGQGLTTP